MGKIFKAGKYKGKQVEWVYGRDKNYYFWAIKNAPNMISDDSIPKHKEEKLSALQPNLDFLKQGPEFNH